jgi:hypothetical protein
MLRICSTDKVPEGKREKAKRKAHDYVSGKGASQAGIF